MTQAEELTVSVVLGAGAEPHQSSGPQPVLANSLRLYSHSPARSVKQCRHVRVRGAWRHLAPR